MAAIQGERSVVIQAPAEEVYAYISDFLRHPEWNHMPTAMDKITDGPVGVGTVFHTEERSSSNTPWFLARVVSPLIFALIGQKGYTEAEITAMEPARRLAWKARAPIRRGDLMRAEYEITLEPEGEATRLTQRYHLQVLVKLIDWMTGEFQSRLFGEETDRNLATLKARLEGSRPGAAPSP